MSMESSLVSPGESLLQFIQRMAYDDPSLEDWPYRYKVTLAKVAGDPELYHEETLKLLWYRRDNWIANVPQGMPSEAQFEKAREQLKKLTFRIQSSPSQETYDFAVAELGRLVEAGVFKVMHRAMLNRVFAAHASDICTSISDHSKFFKVVAFMDEQFQLGLQHLSSDNWFKANAEYKARMKDRLPIGYDPILLNTATWNIYTKLVGDR